MNPYSPPDLNQDVGVVSTFYAASLGDLVGEAYRSPDLSSLATAWVCYPGARPDFTYSTGKASFYLADEFREPAKLLFNAGLARFTDQKIAGLAESWQHKRTYLRPSGPTRVDETTSSMPTT